jgi:hypothetical protein
MTKTNAFTATIADVLDGFFANYLPGASHLTRERIKAVRSDLERHLELEGPRILTSSQIAILNTEKQFKPESAFARTMHAPELYHALEHYLDHAHAQLGLKQREVQVDVVAALAARLWGGPGVSERTIAECCVIQLDLALARARERIRDANRLERALPKF